MAIGASHPPAKPGICDPKNRQFCYKPPHRPRFDIVLIRLGIVLRRIGAVLARKMVRKVHPSTRAFPADVGAGLLSIGLTLGFVG